jgi:hypothetical protein
MAERQDLTTLVLSLEARMDKASNEMAKFDGLVNKHLRSVESRFARAEGVIARFGSSFSRGISLIGGGFAGLAGLRAFGSAIDKIAQIGEIAGRIGVTTRALQAMQQMALQTGASVDQVDKALQSLAEQSAQKGSFLDKLFSANNLKVSTSDTEANLRHFMDLMKNAASESQRLFIATQVFGDKVGRGLVLAFSQGGDALDATFSKLTSSGKAYTDAQIKEADDIRKEFRAVANDIETTWEHMALTMIHALQKVGDALAPLILKFLDEMPPEIVAPARHGRPLTPDDYRRLGTLRQGAAGAYPYQDLIQQAATKNGLDPAILAALIQKESSFNPSAKNPTSSAAGLTQLLSGTAKDLGVTNPYDPAQSISGGAQYLKQLLDRFGNINSALAYYYQGPNSGAITSVGNAYATDVQLRAAQFRPAIGTPPMPPEAGQNTGVAATTGVTQLPPTAEELKKLADNIDIARDAVKGFFSDMITGLRAGQSLTETLSNSFENLSTKLADKALSSIVDLLLGAQGSPSGGVLGGLLGFGTPAGRALGGPVDPGMVYQVHKDELIVPRTPGYVIPSLSPMGGRGSSGSAPRFVVEARPNPYFDIRVRQISGHGDARTLDAARRAYPGTAARFAKLGTTNS